MDCNLIVLAGKLAAEPEIKVFDSGASLLRMLVTVRSEEPRRRIDVLPVVLWDPDSVTRAAMLDSGSVRGRRVWLAGSVQRRFWSEGEGRTSRVEIVAYDIKIVEEREEENL